MPENTLYLGLDRHPVSAGHLDLLPPRPARRGTFMLDDPPVHVRWACDPDHIATRINDHLRLMDHWHQVLPTPILEVDYESIVADPERAARELVAWCGLYWDPACLSFHKQLRPRPDGSCRPGVPSPPIPVRSAAGNTMIRCSPRLFDKIEEVPGSRADNRGTGG